MAITIACRLSQAHDQLAKFQDPIARLAFPHHTWHRLSLADYMDCPLKKARIAWDMSYQSIVYSKFHPHMATQNLAGRLWIFWSVFCFATQISALHGLLSIGSVTRIHETATSRILNPDFLRKWSSTNLWFLQSAGILSNLKYWMIWMLWRLLSTHRLVCCSSCLVSPVSPNLQQVQYRRTGKALLSRLAFHLHHTRPQLPGHTNFRWKPHSFVPDILKKEFQYSGPSKKLQNISRNRKTSNLFENDAFLGSPVLSWLGSILSSLQPSLKWVRGRGHCRSISIIHQDCGTMIADLNSDFIFQCDFTNIPWINFKGEAQRV